MPSFSPRSLSPLLFLPFLSIPLCASSHLFFPPLTPFSCFLSPLSHFLSVIHFLNNHILPLTPCCTQSHVCDFQPPFPKDKKREG